jgi:hypothetical protein
VRDPRAPASGQARRNWLGFVRQEHRDGIYFDDQPARLLNRLAGFKSPDVHKWIDRDVAR